MSNELAKSEQKSGQLVEVAQAYGDDVFGAVSTSGNYLARVQLYTANSESVKEGKIAMAHYGLTATKDNIIDLGKEFDAVAIAWRPKAMELGETIISVFDHTSDEFKRIQEQSEVRDSGCMFGPEYLLWLPSHKQFVTFFCNSKTARRAAPKLRDRLGLPTTFKAVFIKTPKYSWHGPEFIQCSTPFDLPDPEDLAEETSRFNAPPKSEVERVETAAPGATSSGRAR